MKKLTLVILMISGLASVSVFAAEVAKHHMQGTSMEQMIKAHPMMAKMHELMANESCDEAMQGASDMESKD